MSGAESLAVDLETLALEKAKWGFEAISTPFLKFCNDITGWFEESILLTQFFHQNTLKVYFSFHEKGKQMVKHGIFLFDSQSYLTAYWAHLLFTSSAVHRGIWELTCFSVGKALNYPFYAYNVHSHLWGKNLTEKRCVFGLLLINSL